MTNNAVYLKISTFFIYLAYKIAIKFVIRSKKLDIQINTYL